jgi:hypothetical protein
VDAAYNLVAGIFPLGTRMPLLPLRWSLRAGVFPEAAYVASFANYNKTPTQVVLQRLATSAARAATVFGSEDIPPAGEQTERERRECPRPQAVQKSGKLLLIFQLPQLGKFDIKPTISYP